MAFLIPTVGDRRQSDTMLPQTPASPYSSGYFTNTLSNQNAFKDTDRYANGVVPEPIEGNSLTQYLRSMFNWGGLTGQNAFQTGAAGTGQAMDYYAGILSGNPAAMAQAAQPEIMANNAMYGQAKKQLAQFAPMGGGRSNMMAQLPMEQTRTISNIISQIRPQAAQALGQLGTNQQQIANSLLQMIINGQLGVRGQDVNEHGQSMQLAGQMANSLTGGMGSYWQTHP